MKIVPPLLDPPSEKHQPSAPGAEGFSHSRYFNTLSMKTFFKNIFSRFHKKRDDQIKHLSSLVEQTSDAIFSTDINFVINTWNKAAAQMYGYSEKEAIGKVSFELLKSSLEPAQRVKAIEGLKKQGYNKGEFEYTHKNGESISVLSSVTVLHNEAGDVTGYVAVHQDITEQKNIKEQLKTFNQELAKQVQEKTAELTGIFERVTDAFVALDLNWRFTYSNQKADEMFGFPRGHFVGKHIDDLFSKEDAASFYATAGKALKTQSHAYLESYIAAFDMWFEQHIYPSPTGVSVYFRNVTEKKKAEQIIQKEKELSDKLITSLPGIFYFFDHTGKFLRWNDQFEKISGYNAEEISKMHPLDFFRGEEKAYIEGRIMEVFTKGRSDAEANFTTKDERKIPFYFTGVLMEYEGKPCLLGAGIDIAERKNAEEAVRLSEEKYRLLFDQSPMPKWVYDIETLAFLDVNDAAVKNYGFSKEEFLSMKITDIRPEEEKKRLLRYIADRNTKMNGAWTHMKKSGEIINVEVHSHDLLYSNRPSRLVLALDVTQKLEAENKLKETTGQLRELTGYLQNIQEHERAIIAREIHDELGQQLTALKMDIAWLNKKISNKEQSVTERFNDAIISVDSTIRTVRRIATGLRPSVLDDIGLIATIEWQTQEFEKRTGISTNFIEDTQNHHIDKNVSTELFRVLQESLTNIARHSKAKHANISLTKTENRLLLTIQDDGIGFNFDDIKEKRSLGLVGIKERVLLLGGECYIKSKPGEGTVIKVTVPLIH